MMCLVVGSLQCSVLRTLSLCKEGSKSCKQRQLPTDMPQYTASRTKSACIKATRSAVRRLQDSEFQAAENKENSGDTAVLLSHLQAMAKDHHYRVSYRTSRVKRLVAFTTIARKLHFQDCLEEVTNKADKPNAPWESLECNRDSARCTHAPRNDLNNNLDLGCSHATCDSPDSDKDKVMCCLHTCAPQKTPVLHISAAQKSLMGRFRSFCWDHFNQAGTHSAFHFGGDESAPSSGGQDFGKESGLWNQEHRSQG